MTQATKGMPVKTDYVTNAMIHWFSLSADHGHDSSYQGSVAVAKIRYNASKSPGGYQRMRERFLDEGGVFIAKMRVYGTEVPELMSKFYNVIVDHSNITEEVVLAATEVNATVEDMMRSGEILV